MATILSSFLFLLFSTTFPSCDASETRGMFVFGSSLVDNGNNNFLPNTTAKADYLPYGIDSRVGPSGRFSNGKNMVDALGELLRLPYPIPPFLHPDTQGKRIVHGVNFASGGSGILDQTGPVGGTVISLKEQITNFETTTLPELKYELENVGDRKEKEVVDGRDHLNPLSEYLFVVGTGGNDFLLNYFLREELQREVGLHNFTSALISTLSIHLKRLYDLGARKFVLMSVQGLGCVPVVRSNGSCVEPINQAAVLFNSRLRSLVDDTGPLQMPGSHLVYVNSYSIIGNIIRNPSSYGFTKTTTACCELEPKTKVLCSGGGRTCRNRRRYVFFDGLHPTEAVNSWVAKKAYGSRRKNEVYPFNVQRLAGIWM